MRYLIHLLCALCLVALFVVAAHGSPASIPPNKTVRVVEVNGEQICSAVVVAPDLAITARHCFAHGVRVDGKLAERAVMYAPLAGPDVAAVLVPGLQCPCAAIGASPEIGAAIVAVGFPGNANGQQTISETAAVMTIDKPAAVAPFIADSPWAEELNAVYILTDKPILAHGMSGGGGFVVQDGEWKLVGIVAIQIPKVYGEPDSVSGFVPVGHVAKLLLP